jgi:hypothetical protein
MKKFIITEEEKKSIRGLYGLINEQTITLPHSVSDTFDSTNGDAAHNLKGLEKKIDMALEQIYNQGINPKMYDLSFNVVRNGNTFTTTSSLIIDKSDDGKAWTGFASRGSYGPGYETRADDQISGKGNRDGKSLKQRLEEIGAVEIIPISNSPITINNNNVQIKQYFVQFTKSFKPSHTSSKSTPTTPQQPQTNTTPQPSKPVIQTPSNSTNTKTTIDSTKTQTPNNSNQSQPTSNLTSTQSSSEKNYTYRYPGDKNYRYAISNNHWWAKNIRNEKEFELTGKDYKPNFKVSIDNLDKQFPDARPLDSPYKEK